MRCGEENFKAGDGLKLFMRWWLPEAAPRAFVAITHGYTEHSGRYARVAEYLTESGYAVYAFDLRGHGMSEGRRAVVNSFGEYIDDLSCFVGLVKARALGKPFFLLGHSVGGIVAALFVITRRFDGSGLLLSAPFFIQHRNIPSLMVAFNRIVSCFLPWLPVIKRPPSSLISSDPKVVERYEKDPLVYLGSVCSRQGAEISKAANSVLARLERISLPLLILHGTADGLADIEGSRRVYARAGSADKTLKVYEGFYHEVLNEPGRERVLKDMAGWLQEHVP